MADHYDPTDLKGQEAARQAAERAQQFVRLNIAEDYQWLMTNPRGRRLMWGWLSSAGLFRSPFNTSGSIHAFNSGMHNFGLLLNAQIMEHCPETWLLMQNEAKAAAIDAAKGADK